MREADGRRMVTRVKGRQAIVASLVRLVIRCHRFGTMRAATRQDLLWAERVGDQLQETLQVARGER